MPTYVLLSTLTAEGRKTIKQRPERIKEVDKEIEAFGVRVVAQYSVLGPYDFVNIVEAPDNAAVTRLSVELGSRGTIQIMSLPAIPVDEFIRLAGGGARAGTHAAGRRPRAGARTTRRDSP